MTLIAYKVSKRGADNKIHELAAIFSAEWLFKFQVPLRFFSLPVLFLTLKMHFLEVPVFPYCRPSTAFCIPVFFFSICTI